MKKTVVEETVQLVKELMASPTCSAEAKEAAKRWLDAVGGEKEREQTVRYLQELKEDIMPIDALIGFARSDKGAAYFGTKAGEIADHAEAIKAAGAKYCDCPACAVAEAILQKEQELLA